MRFPVLVPTPGDVSRTGAFLDTFDARPSVPVGLPSSLLERRPDIRLAEQSLVAANAQIGAARAEYFPRIALTGLLGVESRDLTELLTAPARLWSIGAAAAAPIFNAGRTRATVRLAESVERELVVNYTRTIYRALREVSDALCVHHIERAPKRTGSASPGARRRIPVPAIDAHSQTPITHAQRNLFRSELDLAALQRQELASIVELYRALGGGWTE